VVNFFVEGGQNRQRITETIKERNEDMLQIRKILCPTDFSEPSYLGLKKARDFAEHFSAELLVVHVVPLAHFISYPGSGFNVAADYFESVTDAARSSLEEVRKNRLPPDLVVRTFILQGSPADQIIDLAGSEKVDMIVTATHGWTGWRKFVFGSVAEKVVRLSPCPVFTVPAPEGAS